MEEIELKENERLCINVNCKKGINGTRKIFEVNLNNKRDRNRKACERACHIAHYNTIYKKKDKIFYDLVCQCGCGTKFKSTNPNKKFLDNDHHMKYHNTVVMPSKNKIINDKKRKQREKDYIKPEKITKLCELCKEKEFKTYTEDRIYCTSCISRMSYANMSDDKKKESKNKIISKIKDFNNRLKNDPSISPKLIETRKKFGANSAAKLMHKKEHDIEEYNRIQDKRIRSQNETYSKEGYIKNGGRSKAEVYVLELSKTKYPYLTPLAIYDRYKIDFYDSNHDRYIELDGSFIHDPFVFRNRLEADHPRRMKHEITHRNDKIKNELIPNLLRIVYDQGVILLPDAPNSQEIIDYYCQNTLWKACKEYLKNNLYEHILNRIINVNINNKKVIYVSGNEFIKSVRKNDRGLGYSLFSNTLLSTICKELNCRNIFDPFAGWGHRLIDAYKNGINYTGFELHEKQSVNLNNILSDIQNRYKLKNNSGYKIINDDCRNFNNYELDFDMVFSCPAYYKIENYHNNEKGFDQIKDYKTYQDELLSLISSIKSYKDVPICFVLPSEYKEWLIYKEERILPRSRSHYTKKSIKTDSLFII